MCSALWDDDDYTQPCARARDGRKLNFSSLLRPIVVVGLGSIWKWENFSGVVQLFGEAVEKQRAEMIGFLKQIQCRKIEFSRDQAGTERDLSRQLWIAQLTLVVVIKSNLQRL